ncbi:MAG: CheR family methyltransferase [Bacillota bacterium]
MNNYSSPAGFAMIQQLIEEKCGIALSREKSYLLENKLSRLLPQYGLSSLEELYLRACLEESPEIIEEIIEAVAINETFWFRDRTPWQIIEDMLLPDFVKVYRNNLKDKLRIWSAACSNGQEPYSIAMCINRFLRINNITDVPEDNIEILATDISKNAILKAAAGEYDGISVSRGLEDQYKYMYFSKAGRIWKLSEEIKRRVDFRHFNLIGNDYPDKLYDIVFCRNVLIYFSGRFKKHVMEGMAKALKPGGVLFIGSSELYEDYSKYFSMEQHQNGIYYRKRE